MSTPSVEATSRTLESLESGQRAWFWFCAATDDVDPPLILTPLSEDPGMTQLVDQVERVKIPREARECVGLASVDESGRLHFGSPEATGEMLPALATWTRSRLQTQPALARLSDAAFVRYDDRRTILDRWEDPALWADIERPSVPGSLSEASDVLDGLKPGDGAWFWMSHRGPGRVPFLALQPIAEDPDGKGFAKRVRRLVLRSPEKPDALVGVLQVLKSGKLVFTGTDAANRAGAILSALCSQPRFERLQGAVVLQKSKQGFADGVSVEPEELEEEIEILEQLQTGGEAYFFFTDATEDGLPELIIEADKEAVKEDAKKLKGTGQMCVGQLRLADEGRIVFETRKAFPGMLPALARWVATYLAGWPKLEAYRGATLAIVDARGETVERIEDPDAWTVVPKGGA